MADTHNKIVLASSSKYRKEQLKQLNLSFVTQSPDIDETAYVNENAVDLVSRLAQSKAQAIAGNHPKSLIIGADQVLVGPLNKGQDINSLSHQFIIGKSGGFEKAFRQLKSLQNQEAELVSGLALYNSDTDSLQQSTCRHRIVYRKLTDAQIERYLLAEEPYDCAGSAKIEKLGIGLIKSINGDDPSAIIGLPLISLISMLNEEGVRLF